MTVVVVVVVVTCCCQSVDPTFVDGRKLHLMHALNISLKEREKRAISLHLNSRNRWENGISTEIKELRSAVDLTTENGLNTSSHATGQL